VGEYMRRVLRLMRHRRRDAQPGGVSQRVGRDER
jgi:hypothetical protein